MANKGYYVKRTKRRGLKVFCVILALLFLAACAGGGYGWYQVRELKKKIAALTVADNSPVAIDGDGNELVSGQTYAMPSSMAFMRSTAEDTVEEADDEGENSTVITPGGPVTLTANIKTEFSQYIQGLNYVWTVEFMDPHDFDHADYKEGLEGTWMNPFCPACNYTNWMTYDDEGHATDEKREISDYITITPTTDTAETVEVECLKPFGCPMQITVRLEKAPQVKGTCRLDYIRRVTYDKNNYGNYSLFQLYDNVNWRLTYEYGVGTVKGEPVLNAFRLKLESVFFTSYVKKMLTFDITAVALYTSAAFEMTVIPELGVIVEETTTATSLPTRKSNMSVMTSNQDHCITMATFIKDFNRLSAKQRDAINYAWYYVCQHRYTSIYTPNIYVDLLYDYTYNGVKISTFGLSNGQWRFDNALYGKGLEPNELVVSSSKAVI